MRKTTRTRTGTSTPTAPERARVTTGSRITFCIYGLRQEADKDLRYVPVELNGNQYLVNANGVVQKASSSSKSSTKPELGNGFKDYKDENDKIWVVSTEGVIQQ